jgi:hypothetical protein
MPEANILTQYEKVKGNLYKMFFGTSSQPARLLANGLLPDDHVEVKARSILRIDTFPVFHNVLAKNFDVIVSSHAFGLLGSSFPHIRLASFHRC